jgi:glucose/arabinose dehydrogenase
LARSRRRILLVTLPLAAIVLGIIAWVLIGQQLLDPPPKVSKSDATAAAKSTLRSIPTATPHPAIVDTGEVVPPRTDVYVDGVSMPVGLTFAPDGRLFFSEAFSGTVRVAKRTGDQAELLTTPFATLTIAKGGEAGALGLVLDPNYQQNNWIYLYYSSPDPNRADRRPLYNRVVRFTDVDNVGTDMTVIFDNIPMSREGRHNGGRMLFGPDGKLYVTVGNAEEKENSQDLSNPNGKVLRLNPDGTIPSDNPFPDSPIYAYGFRNMFGLALHPTTHSFYVTENSGDSHDEINRIEAGGDYGFPYFEGPGGDARYIDPIWESGARTLGLTGITFYTGDQLPQYRGDLFFCAINTGSLTRLRLSSTDYQTVQGSEVVANNCQLDVTNGPDGALYYSSVSQIIRLGR